MRLEPISKSLEEDNEASELYEAEEVLGVVFPTDEDAALPLNPSKEALHEAARSFSNICWCLTARR
jgi:hypothetical protein